MKTIVAACMALGALALLQPVPTRAQSAAPSANDKVTIMGWALNMSNTATGANQTIRINIDRWSNASQRQHLISTFIEKKQDGLLKALEKRPVASEAIDAAVAHICHKLRALGEREVASRLIGELTMEQLHHLDEVAYVRFASVYRSFQDVDAFREEIERMRHRRTREETENQLGLWTGSEPPKKR